MNALSSGVDLEKYNGFCTARNSETGEHRTFRVRTARRGALKGERIVGLLTGPDNTVDYSDFGFLLDSGRVAVWRSKRGAAGFPSQWDRLARFVERRDWFAENRGVEFDLSIRCRVCNRELTDPLSIDLGIGPKCRGEE